MKAFRYRWNRSSQTVSAEGLRQVRRSVPFSIFAFGIERNLDSILHDRGRDGGRGGERAAPRTTRRGRGLRSGDAAENSEDFAMKSANAVVAAAPSQYNSRRNAVANGSADGRHGIRRRSCRPRARAARVEGARCWPATPGALRGRCSTGLEPEIIRGAASRTRRVSRPRCAGVDAIVHVAGLVEGAHVRRVPRGQRPWHRAPGRGGTPRRRPTRTFLLISSQAAAGPSREGRPVSATTIPPARSPGTGSPSGKPRRFCRARGRDPGRCSGRPSSTGPGDTGALSVLQDGGRRLDPRSRGFDAHPAHRRRAGGARRRAGRSAGSELFGRLRFLLGPRARDAANASPKPSPGTPGRRARLIRVPNGLVRVLGAAETALETVTRRSQPFNADKAREILAGDWFCDGSPLARVLGLPEPVPHGRRDPIRLGLVPWGGLASRGRGVGRRWLPGAGTKL